MEAKTELPKGLMYEQVVTITVKRNRSVLSDESIVTAEQTASLLKYSQFWAVLDALKPIEVLETDKPTDEAAS